MAEPQTWAEVVAKADGTPAPAAAKSWDQIVAEANKDPGYLGELGRGLKAGVKVQLPKMVGQAAKFFGADETGDALIEGAEARNTPDLQESGVGQAHESPWSIRGNVYEAATNAVPSLLPGAAGAAIGAGVGSIIPGVGTALGALAGYAVGSIASLPIFYGSQGQESYEAVKKTQLEMGKAEPEADRIARATGHAEGAIEAGGELVADVIPFAKLFKPLIRPVTKVAGTLVKDTIVPTFKQGLKTVGGVVGGEVATEMGQQAGEDYVRKSMGDTGHGATWEETAKVIMPTALMSVIPGAAGAGAVHLKRKAAAATLVDEDADPETRSKIAMGIATALEPVDAKVSRGFANYAARQIYNHQPIEIGNDSLYLTAGPLLLENKPIVAGAPAATPVDMEEENRVYAERNADEARRGFLARTYEANQAAEKTGEVLQAGTIEDAIAAAQDAVSSIHVAEPIAANIRFAQNGRMLLERMEKRAQEEAAYAEREQQAIEREAELARLGQEDATRTNQSVIADKVAGAGGSGVIAQAMRKAVGLPEDVAAPRAAAPVAEPAKSESSTKIPTTPEAAAAATPEHLEAARNLTRSAETKALIDEELARRAAPSAATAAPATATAVTPAPEPVTAAPPVPATTPAAPPAPVAPSGAPVAKAIEPLRIRGQTPQEMTIAQLQAIAKSSATQFPDWQEAVAKELKARDKKGETFLGRTIEQLTDAELKLAGAKGKTAALRQAAAAETEKRAGADQALAVAVKRPGMADTLKALAEQSGWAERGGHMIRTKTGESAGQEKITRTKWVPRAEWWPTRPVAEGEDFYRAAVEKAIAGEPLSRKQKDVVRFLIGLAEDQNTGVDVPEDSTPQETAKAQDVVDHLGPPPDRWSTMSEEEKDAELDAKFGGSPSEEAVAQREENRQAVAQGEVGPRGESREREPGEDDEVASAPAETQAAPEPGESDFMKQRNATIKASRAAGNTHLDKVPADVETMRGREIFNVHDPKERGVIRTVDIHRNVYVDWKDQYSADKNLAKPTQEGKRTVYRTSLGPTDLNDYALSPDKRAARPSLELTAPTEADLRAKEEQAATGNVEEKTAQVRDRNNAILTPPAGTAPRAEIKAEDRQPVSQQNLFSTAASALREAAEKIEKASTAAPTPKPAEKIADFGEKIGGARKDVWTAFTDKMKEAFGLNVADQPLSKSWPEPEYQALLDNGADPWSVAFMHAARDEIPAKPRQPWKVKRWAEQVTLLRDFAMRLADGSLPTERAKQELSKMSQMSRGFSDMVSRIELYEMVGHAKSLDGVRVRVGEYSLYEGKEYNPARVVWSVEKDVTATAMSNWPRMLATGATKAEALANFKEKYASLIITPTASKETSFDIFSKRGENGYWIGKKIGRNPLLLAGPFANIKEARAYKDEKHDELVAKLEKAKEIPNVRRETNEPRVGADMRNGQDVTPQMFGETFGFRGVEFGNWVEQGRRQKDLNDAFDALMDMAAILGVSPKALSLNGELGLAFGARGKGGIDAASAHYEPGKVVINLTKTGGAGSLGHEWWHALDNYFSRARAKKDDYLTEGLDVSLAARGSQYVHQGEVRKEMVDAFGRVVRAIKETAMRARAAKLDSKRGKDYWTTGREMSARAYESYLISKLQDQNASNDYLANIVDEETWKAAESMGFELDESYPYPTAGEVPKIRAAFDDFFKTVQTKETDKGVAMFSRASDADGTPLLSFGAVRLTDARPIDQRFAFEGGKAVQYTILRGAKPAGTVTLNWKSGAASHLLNIEVDESQRNNGLAERVVRGILMHNGQAPMRAVHVMPLARGFWQKMGGEFVATGDGEDAILTRERYLDAFRAREAARGAVSGTEEDSGPASFAKGEGRSEAARGSREGLAPAAVRAAVRKITEKWGNAPDWVVIESMADAPTEVREQDEGARSQGAEGDPAGFIYNDRVYLVASGIRSEAHAIRTLFHEAAGHFGLRHTLGKRLNSVLDEVSRSAQKRVEAKGIEYGLGKRTEQGFEWLADKRMTADDARRSAAEEVLAEIAQERPNAGIIRRAIAAIRQFLRELGVDLKLSDNDIVANFILPARGFIERGEQATEGSLAAAFHRAFHGTPHDFERFDISKIGTGEGAQVYGHGLYFAGRQEVAEHYRKTLSGPDEYRQVMVNGISETDIFRGAYPLQGQLTQDELKHGLGMIIYYARLYKDPAKGIEEARRVANARAGEDADSAAAKRLFEAARVTAKDDVRKGKLYEVNLRPQEDEYLDWDRPLSEQKSDVLASIKDVFDRMTNEERDHRKASSLSREFDRLDKEQTGEEFYKSLSKMLGSDEAASRALAKEGVPGIRYLDGSSRSAGEGTHNYVIFDDKHVKIAAKFSRGAHMGTLTADQEVALKNVHGEPATWKQRLDEFKANWKKNLVQGIFDQYAPIAQYSPRAYRLARQTKGGDSTLEALLLYGKVYVDKDGAYRVDYTKKGGMNGFAKVIAELKGEQDRFLEWVAAHRAERLKSIGLENLYSDKDIAALKTLSQGSMKDGSSRAAAYAKALKDLNEFNDSVLKIAADSGLIDEETRQMYRDVPYVPFYRLQEEGVSGFGMKAGLVNQSAWKKLKGGTEHLNDDLLANLLQNWSHMITASAKNRAAKATLEAAVRARVAEEVPTSTPGKGLVHYREAGKDRVFRVSDNHLMDAIAAMDYAGLGAVGKPFVTMKRYLTIGVTVNPAFKIRNLIRDSIQAIGTAELSYNPAKNIAQGFKATAKESETRAQLLAGGGMIRFGSMLDGNNADRTRRLIESGVDPDLILDNASKIERFWKGKILPAFEAYQELGDRGEQISRAALYEQLTAKGMSHEEAAFWARDLLDFSLSGKWGAVRILTQIVPFANARLQGMYKLGRATKSDYRRMGTVLGGVALASIALLLAYNDDDDWKKREDFDRDNYWWFKVNGLAFRVPKPFEIGAVGTLAERSVEFFISDEMNGKRFRERMAATVFSQLNMNPTPQLVKPLLDIYANKDAFTGRPIETMGMEKLRKEDRYTERTSVIAKFLGQLGLPDPTQLAMGQWNTLSPVQIDSLVRGYFGWLGSSTTTALDWGIRPMVNAGERPDMKLRDVFLAGNFVETLPSGSSRYVTRMYEQAKEIEEAYGSYRDAVKRGDMEKAAEIREQEREKLQKHHLVETIKRREALLTAQAKRIEASKDIPGDEKRRRLDQIEQRKSDLARQLR